MSLDPTAILPRVSGPAVVKANLRMAGTNVWTTLGYTADGVTATIQSFNRNVFSDRLGGSEGVPIDVQKFGGMAKIPLQLSEYNEDALLKLLAMSVSVPDVTNGVVSLGTPGEIKNVGCLQMTKGAVIQLLVVGEKDLAIFNADNNATVMTPFNFPTCVLDEPFELPVGSKNSIVSFGLTALPFTAWDTANGGDGKTRLYIKGTSLVERPSRYSGA